MGDNALWCLEAAWDQFDPCAAPLGNIRRLRIPAGWSRREADTSNLRTSLGLKSLLHMISALYEPLMPSTAWVFTLAAPTLGPGERNLKTGQIDSTPEMRCFLLPRLGCNVLRCRCLERLLLLSK
jgi:hypothetical protein